MSLSLPGGINTGTISKIIPKNELSSSVVSKIKVPDYSKKTTDCPNLKLPDLFSTAHLPKFDIDTPDWKLGNIHALDKVGSFFSSLEMPDLPSFKMSELKLNGMFDSFKCLGINDLNPNVKDLKFKQSLKDLNNINCNSLNVFDNDKITNSLFKSLMAAANCSKSSKDATKGAVGDIASIKSSVGMDSKLQANLSKAVVDGVLHKKFSASEAKNLLKDNVDVKNMFKTSIDTKANPGKLFQVTNNDNKQNVSEKNSIVDFASSLSSPSKIAGKNNITELAKKATKDASFNGSISGSDKSINTSQKISLLSKLKSNPVNNGLVKLESMIA